MLERVRSSMTTSLSPARRNKLFHINMTKNYNNKKNKTRKRRQRTTQRTMPNNFSMIQHLGSVRMPAGLRGTMPFPARSIHTQHLNEQRVLNSLVNGYLFCEYKMNDVFAPNPLTADQASGFAPLALIYNIFRVLNFRIKVDTVNLSATTPITVGVIFRDTQPSLSLTSFANCQSSMETGPCCGPYQVATVNGNNIRSIPLCKVRPGVPVGNELTYMTEQGYEGTTIASPTQVVWVAVVVLSSTAATPLINGVNLALKLAFTTEWHSLQSIIN